MEQIKATAAIADPDVLEFPKSLSASLEDEEYDDWDDDDDDDDD